MQHIRTYEELSLFGLFSSPEKRKLSELIKSLKGSNWLIKKTSDGYNLKDKSITNKEIKEVVCDIKVKDRNLELIATIVPVYPRTKICKEIFKILKARPLTIDFEGRKFTIRYEMSEDYSFKIKESISFNTAVEDKFEIFLKTDFQALYEEILNSWKKNDLLHQKNSSDIKDFFSQKSELENILTPIKVLSDSLKVKMAESQQMTRNIQLLNPRIDFLFKFENSNFMRKSQKQLILTDKLVKSLDLLLLGMRRVSKASKTCQYDVFVSDKNLYIKVQDTDETTLKQWEEDQDSFYDYFIELEDYCQSSTIKVSKYYSKDLDKSVFNGYEISFNFQTIIASVEQSHRIFNPILIFKGMLDPNFFNAMKKSIACSKKIEKTFSNVDAKVLITDRRLIVNVELHVSGTWQDTTRKEQLQDEMDFEELED